MEHSNIFWERKRMRTIIAGSREITDYALIERGMIDVPFNVTEVVSGGARGVDTLGERWARENGIPIKIFPADWKIGRSAGILRNTQMANYAEALVAFHFNGSRGTANMIEQAKRHGLKVFVVKF
jgi:predicted Rossmann fold nucleotide-binding protein DprA/Smf involved in DNA uptake